MQLNRTVTAPDTAPDTAKGGTDIDTPPVVLVHGLFGTGRNLGVLARRLADRTVIQVDMRNHGDSGWSDDASYAAMADDLAAVIEEAAGGRADVVGHSMGGKAAMVLALTRPERVRRLAVLDIAPVEYSHSQAPLIDAMATLPLADLTRRSEADARLAERVEDPATRAFLLQSLDLRAEPPRWKMNLDALRAAMPALTGWPDGLVPGAFAGPMLVLAGAESDYVDRAAEAALHRFFPQARLSRIDGTGHWLHAQAPGPVGEAVAGFLA